MAFRVGGAFFSESFLREIIGSLADDSIGRILEFTTVLDERNKLAAYGFLVELDGDIGMVLRTTTAHARLLSSFPRTKPRSSSRYRPREAADRRCL